MDEAPVRVREDGVLVAPVIIIGDPIEIITAFLDDVSPEDLEERSLMRDESVPEAMLNVLKEMARER